MKVNGTTGEGKSLTKKERKKVAEKWILTSCGRLELWGNLRQFKIQYIHQANVTLYMKMFIIKENVQKNAKFICIKAPVFFMYRYYDHNSDIAALN